ncbi:DUF2620 domain-containing protein [Clostridiales bacterium COT073_COT-073]|nr:DUF2620 domain-containing protein [Clostridiales bacterium COT073_COT-073]
MKIVVGGAVEKQAVADLIKKIAGEKAEVLIMSDVQAAMAIKSKAADYYFGACHTGGGGALSMAIALLTKAKCATISMPGRPPKEEDVAHEVAEGKVAFGFTADHMNEAVPMILKHILA